MPASAPGVRDFVNIGCLAAVRADRSTTAEPSRHSSENRDREIRAEGWQQILAASANRDEHVFPLPAVLESKPTLVGYYRLLLGSPQKTAYGSGTGMGPFRRMETAGVGEPTPSRWIGANSASERPDAIITTLSPARVRNRVRFFLGAPAGESFPHPRSAKLRPGGSVGATFR
jgi:hypothetical protein